MIQSEKHSSLEKPPDLPFFKTKNKNKCANSENTSSSSSTSSSSVQSSPTPIATSMSPSKRVALRSECMKQLDTWHSLLEKGSINKEQYEEIQHGILQDIKQNFT